MFTNADTLTNKMAELRSCMTISQPIIVGISEVKPKFMKRTLN